MQRDELVHDATLGTHILVFGLLTHTGKLHAVEVATVQFIQSKGKTTLKRRRRAHARTQRDIPSVHSIEPSHLHATGHHFAHHPVDITEVHRLRPLRVVDGKFALHA